MRERVALFGGTLYIQGAPDKGTTVLAWIPERSEHAENPTEKPRSFLIVDDHAVVRRGLRQVVAEECDGTVVGEVSTGQAAFDVVRLEDWALVILDINLPDKNGLEVLKDPKRSATPCRSLSLATMQNSNMRLASHLTGDVGAAAS